jgi:hypothetical protein
MVHRRFVHLTCWLRGVDHRCSFQRLAHR